MDDDNTRFLRRRILLGVVFLIALLTIIISIQKPFKNHKFLLGQIDEITGIYYDSPYPMIIANPGGLPEDISTDILLVGFGKFGARSTMDDIQAKHGSLNGHQITIQGTLIYGDNKTLLELTKGTDSYISKSAQAAIPHEISTQRVDRQMMGEILDPKCYFGAMKPGEGKIHKSCAIRCISGGIPPVFRHDIHGNQSSYEYYLLVGLDGESINDQILKYIAEEIRITGQSVPYHTWQVLYIDPNEVILL